MDQPSTETPARRRRVLLFLGSALTVVLLFELGARQLGPNTSQIPRMLDSHRTNLAVIEPDWLFVGDSSVGAAVDPHVFDEGLGETSYNLWQPTASMRVVERVLFDYGLSLSDPSAVAIGVTGRMFNGATSEELLALQLRLETSVQWQRVSGPSPYTRLESVVGDRLALVRYRAGLRKPSDWYRALTIEQPVETDDRGHLTFPESFSVNQLRPRHQAAERAALENYEPGEDEFEALVRTIDRLHERGIAVFVVELPVYEPVYHEYYPRGELDVADFRDELTRRLDGGSATFVDLSDFGQDPLLFSDENHLNASAARRFSTELADRLAEAGR